MNSVNDIGDNLFGVPVWGMVLNNHQHMLQKYIDFVYDVKQNESSKNRSNLSGYQTRDNLHTEPLFADLIEAINNIGNEIVGNYVDGKNYRVSVDSLWANVNNKGAGNYPHIHSGDLSGVFYLKIPDNSGNIVFINPAQRSERQTIRIANREIHVGPLVCLLFPSWLEHYVKPNESEEDRISISFNIAEVR